MISYDSPLLLNTPPLVILPKLAVAIGLNEAIVLQQLHYLVRLSKGKKGHFKQDRWWTWQTHENWRSQFTWWSLGTIRRIFANLKKLKVVLTGSFSKAPDTTLWYTIDYEVYNTLTDQIDQSGKLEDDQFDQPVDGSPINSISRVDQIDQSGCSKRSNDLYTEITPYITPKTTLIPPTPQGESNKGNVLTESEPIPDVSQPLPTPLSDNTNMVVNTTIPHKDQSSGASLKSYKVINETNETDTETEVQGTDCTDSTANKPGGDVSMGNVHSRGISSNINEPICSETGGVSTGNILDTLPAGSDRCSTRWLAAEEGKIINADIMEKDGSRSNGSSTTSVSSSRSIRPPHISTSIDGQDIQLLDRAVVNHGSDGFNGGEIETTTNCKTYNACSRFEDSFKPSVVLRPWRKKQNRLNDYHEGFQEYIRAQHLPTTSPYSTNGKKPMTGDAKNWILARDRDQDDHGFANLQNHWTNYQEFELAETEKEKRVSNIKQSSLASQIGEKHYMDFKEDDNIKTCQKYVDMGRAAFLAEKNWHERWLRHIQGFESFRKLISELQSKKAAA